MDMFQTFEEFLVASSVRIPMLWFSLNLIFTGTLAFILKQVYIKYGNTLSNRKSFSNNFLMIAMTTMLIITVVKTSLALSLGLVGALSIIRFRAAIKEPEELAYLFLAISIGLGFGANQGVITALALLIILLIIFIMRKEIVNSESSNLYLTISSNNNSHDIDLNKIIDVLNKFCSSVNIKRLDESNEAFEVSFLVEYDNHKKLIDTQKAIAKINSNLKFTFLDNNIL